MDITSGRFPEVLRPGYDGLDLVSIMYLNHEGPALGTHHDPRPPVESGMRHASMDAGVKDDVHPFPYLELLELISDG
jgi:hypothetical protein